MRRRKVSMVRKEHQLLVSGGGGRTTRPGSASYWEPADQTAGKVQPEHQAGEWNLILNSESSYEG